MAREELEHTESAVSLAEIGAVKGSYVVYAQPDEASYSPVRRIESVPGEQSSDYLTAALLFDTEKRTFDFKRNDEGDIKLLHIGPNVRWFSNDILDQETAKKIVASREFPNGEIPGYLKVPILEAQILE